MPLSEVLGESAHHSLTNVAKVDDNDVIARRVTRPALQPAAGVNNGPAALLSGIGKHTRSLRGCMQQTTTVPTRLQNPGIIAPPRALATARISIDTVSADSPGYLASAHCQTVRHAPAIS
jgi:hypothetical protein